MDININSAEIRTLLEITQAKYPAMPKEVLRQALRFFFPSLLPSFLPFLPSFVFSLLFLPSFLPSFLQVGVDRRHGLSEPDKEEEEEGEEAQAQGDPFRNSGRRQKNRASIWAFVDSVEGF
jgi:hypothetical protein